MRASNPPEGKKCIIPETVFEDTDTLGTEWTVKDKFQRRGDLQVFFEDGSLMIRQEKGTSVDLLEVSIGQANDLLFAIAKALELPVRVY